MKEKLFKMLNKKIDIKYIFLFFGFYISFILTYILNILLDD